MCQNGSAHNTGQRQAGREAGWACAQNQEHRLARRLVSGHWCAASGQQGGLGTGEGGRSVWGKSRAQGSAWNGKREKMVIQLEKPRPRASLAVIPHEKRLESLYCLLLQHALDICSKYQAGKKVKLNHREKG